MNESDRVFVFLSSEAAELLDDKGITLADLMAEAKLPSNKALADDPGNVGSGTKEIATIILASAAAVAAATPLLRELIRNVSGRTPVIRERSLIQARDAQGAPMFDESGQPIMAWHEIDRANMVGDKVGVKGFGIEISFESQ